MRVNLVYLDTGDWIGVYRDDNLVYQGHSIDAERLCHVLDIPFTAHYDVSAEANGWQCPGTFIDLK